MYMVTNTKIKDGASGVYQRRVQLKCITCDEIPITLRSHRTETLHPNVQEHSSRTSHNTWKEIKLIFSFSAD